MDTERTLALGLEPLLTTSELADYLGLHVQAIYDMRCAGEGPVAIPVGKGLRYRAVDVRAWLEGRQQTPIGHAVANGGER